MRAAKLGLWVGSSLAVIIVAGTGGLAQAAPIRQAVRSLSFTVNTVADAHDAKPGNGKCATSAGKCSLRAAIEESNAQPKGITVSVRLRSGTYKLKLGTLTIGRNTVFVTGAGQKATVVEGSGASAVVSVAARAHASLAQFEITQGGAGKQGGGLYNSGTTTLSGVTVTGNTAASGGGITNTAGANLHLVSSTVSNNTATSGADSHPGGPAGGINNAGSLTASGSTVTGNMAGRGGLGINDTGGNGGNGGGIVNTGTLVATGSTISDNFAGSGGPGNQEVPGSGGSGGGIYSPSGSVTLTGTTVLSNTAATPARTRREMVWALPAKAAVSTARPS